MNWHSSPITFNRKNNNESSEKRIQQKKGILTRLITLTLISFIVNAPQMIIVASPSSEPTINNDMVFSLKCINSLEIENVKKYPNSPNYDEPVTVTTKINKGSYEIDEVILKYQIGSDSWTKVSMSLENSEYVAVIPAQQYGLRINYKVIALDTGGNSNVSPVYSYTVGDFVAPAISDVVLVPSTPNPGLSVTVTAKVTEPIAASGVKNALLWYNNASVWSSKLMTFHKGLWITTIPGQPSGSSIQLFVKAFDNAGNYDQTSTFRYTVNTFNSPPTAEFSSPSSANTNKVVNFDASASYDSDGSIIKYNWDFGDGTTATGVITSHAYDNEGEYVVTLTVMDNRATSDSVSKSILIENLPSVQVNNLPKAIFTEQPKTAHATETITFDASESYDTDGTITTYTWNFGDETTATGMIAPHVYENSGSYIVKLTVTDNEEATDSTTLIKTILNNAPVAGFTQTSEEANKYEEVVFDASESFDVDGTIVEHVWNFGDETTATGITVDHSYSNRGVYTVTLIVTDNEGATDSTTSTVNVVNQEPLAIFTANTMSVTENQAIQFDASESYDTDGTITTYTWNFGDETTATGATTEHTYTQEGNFTVTLTVTDNEGASASTNTTVNVVAEPAVTLAVLSVIGLGITALTATLLYGLFIRRNKKKKSKKSY